MSLDYLECARGTIQEIQYITIATIHTHIDSWPMSRPWNSPVYSAFDSDYNFYWVSDRHSQHSKNIRKNPNVFLAIYNSTIPEGTGSGRGVYIQAQARELSNPDEISYAHQLLAGRVGKKFRTPAHFLDDTPRRIYQATPQRAWVNDTEKRNGHLIDIRVEIDLSLLRSQAKL
jgi:nitroimidazol reductase NimA-like FMN-containing flavoprotein (pyridoxamine 5'-phosphate oxidase superfamily)